MDIREWGKVRRTGAFTLVPMLTVLLKNSNETRIISCFNYDINMTGVFQLLLLEVMSGSLGPNFWISSPWTPNACSWDWSVMKIYLLFYINLFLLKFLTILSQKWKFISTVYCRKKYQYLQIYQTFITACDYFFTFRVHTTSEQGWCVMSVSHDKVERFAFSWSSWLVLGESPGICNHLVTCLL